MAIDRRRNRSRSKLSQFVAQRGTAGTHGEQIRRAHHHRLASHTRSTACPGHQRCRSAVYRFGGCDLCLRLQFCGKESSIDPYGRERPFLGYYLYWGPLFLADSEWDLCARLWSQQSVYCSDCGRSEPLLSLASVGSDVKECKRLEPCTANGGMWTKGYSTWLRGGQAAR